MKTRSKAPGAAQILIFVGGAVILFTGILAILGIPLSFTFMSGHIMVYPIYTMSTYIGLIGLTCGFLVMLSAFLMGRRNRNEIQYWSAAAMIFAIVGLFGGGGLLIGSLLALAGSVLGISYRPIVLPNVRAIQSPNAGQVRHPNNHEQMRIMASLKAEEKKLYEITNGTGGAIFQADLVEKSGFSKVKVSRILDALEGRGLIERRRRGMTNMVVLKNSNNTIM